MADAKPPLRLVWPQRESQPAEPRLEDDPEYQAIGAAVQKLYKDMLARKRSQKPEPRTS